MRISELMSQECVVTGIKANSKRQVLQELSKKASEVTGLSERTIFDIILERESLGTTGVGNGVAIPHGRVDNIKKVFGVFAKLDNAIDFESVDSKPVDLVFMLLAPEAAGADHLKALAKVSRTVKDEATRNSIRASNDTEAIYALLNKED
jgi:PTS system nitrogen regulatory IIA component